MTDIILFTHTPSILKHWQRILKDSYNTIHISNYKILKEYLEINTNDINIITDEESVQDIRFFLENMLSYPHAILLLFNSLPDAHHAATLIGKNVRAYENSYVNKINLLKILKTIEDGKNWFFVDLTNYIVKKFLQSSSQDEPSFVKKLTNKERTITLLLAKGFSNKEILQVEKISLSTVKGHIQKIFEKAGVSNRVSLALMFK